MKKLLAVSTFFIASISAFANTPSERRFIDKGMTEGEVIMKIGKPDHKSTGSRYSGKKRGAGNHSSQKQWTYMPTEGDSQTITTITIASGKVVDVDRKISRK